MTLEIRPAVSGLRASPGQRPAYTRVTRVVEQPWMASYRRRLVVSDVLVVLYSLIGSHFIRFGTRVPQVSDSEFKFSLSYMSLGFVIGIGWIAALALADTRSIRVIGTGGEEYRRVIKASVSVFATLAVLSYLTGLDVARGYVAIAGPVGLALLALERWHWRRWLVAQRRAGEASRRVVVLGSPIDVAHICAELERVPTEGLKVVGVCMPDHLGLDLTFGSARNVGDVNQLLDEVRRGAVDGVVVASGGDRSRETLRQLGWALEGTGASLMVVPSLANVAGKRIHIQPVAGVTLMHVEEPKLPRGGQVLKEALDRVGAATLIVIFSPVLLGVGLAVRLTSSGPAFFRQERIGRDGTIFMIWKFRSMRLNADDELQALLRAAGRGDTPLFKLDNDPRVTPVGALIRKFSIDELPQLFNVLAGQMSLVGPRPQRAAEVELYDELARRRLLAKPGMTGLWQVSGRSDLPWDEAVRRDVYYVENWSFTFDLILMWKTVWTVARCVGAR